MREEREGWGRGWGGRGRRGEDPGGENEGPGGESGGGVGFGAKRVQPRGGEG